MDAEGFVYLTGRASDMYISGGSNIYPREIEEKLLMHPAISEVAVLGVPDPVWGEVGMAVCVCHGEPPADLLDWLSAPKSRATSCRAMWCSGTHCRNRPMARSRRR